MVCERVRAQVSIELDGELSELERRMLDSHLASCLSCRNYAADVVAFTTELRNAPLERMSRPIHIHRPRHVATARVHVGLVAALAIAVVGSVLQLGLPAPQGGSPRDELPTRFPTLAEGQNEMKQVIADGRAFERRRSGPTFVL
jgi:anti-sigma factor RsiW